MSLKKRKTKTELESETQKKTKVSETEIKVSSILASYFISPIVTIISKYLTFNFLRLIDNEWSVGVIDDQAFIDGNCKWRQCCEHLSNFINLKKIVFVTSAITDEELAQMVLLVPNVEHLNIQQCSRAGAETIKALKYCTQLKSLSIYCWMWGNLLTESFLKTILTYLTKLEFIDLRLVRFTLEQWTTLYRHLPHIKEIKFPNISVSEPLLPVAVEYLLSRSPHWSGLSREEICFNNNKSIVFDQPVVDFLFNLPPPISQGKELLTLEGIPLVECLDKVAYTCPKLKRIAGNYEIKTSFHNASITEKLSRVLLNCLQLEEIDLDNAFFGEFGYEQLIMNIKSHHNLKKINLSKCYFQFFHIFMAIRDICAQRKIEYKYGGVGLPILSEKSYELIINHNNLDTLNYRTDYIYSYYDYDDEVTKKDKDAVINQLAKSHEKIKVRYIK